MTLLRRACHQTLEAVRAFPFLAALIFVALAYTCWLAAVAWHYRYVFPFGDAITIEIFIRYLWNPANPLSLFTWYGNEHRPVFPLLVFIADHYLNGAGGEIPLVLSLLCNAALVGFTLAVDRTQRFESKTVVIAVATSAIVFWPGHHENLIWPSQFYVYWALFTGIGAIVILLRTRPYAASSWRAFAVAVLLFQSCFSFAYGFVLTGIVLAVAMLRPGLKRMVIAAGAVLALSLFIYYLLFAGHSQFGTSARSALRIVDMATFVLRYVGAPITMAFSQAAGPICEACTTDAFRLHLSLALGALAAAGSFAALMPLILDRVRGGRKDLSPTHWFFLSMSAFAFASALITAAARLDYGPMFPVVVSRYFLISALFWVGAISYLIVDFPRARGWAMGFAGVCTVLFIASVAPNIRTMSVNAAMVRVGGVAGMSHLPALNSGFWLPDLLPDLHAKYQETRSLLFSHPWARLFDRPLAEAGLRRDDGRCRGEVSEVSSIGGVDEGYQLKGALTTTDGAEWLIVSDASGRVVGYGAAEIDQAREDQARGWTGFARGGALPLSVDALIDGDVLCRTGMATAAAAPPLTYPVSPVRTDFEAASRAVGPGAGLICPEATERVRWITGELLCMPMR